MNIEKVLTFLTVAETNNLSLSAKKLNLTQSAVSQQIASLEKEIGLKLIIRTRRGIELTNDGKDLLPDFQKIYEDYRKLIGKAQQNKHLGSPLRIFYTGYIEQNIISKAISLFDFSDVFSLSLRYGSYREAYSALITGECDLALTTSYEFADSSFYKEKIATVELQIIAKKRTFQGKEVALGELKGYNFLILNQTTGIHLPDMVRKFVIDQLEIPEDKIIECDSIESQLLLIQSGKSISMMPPSPYIETKFQALPIKNRRYTQEIVGIYIRKTSEISHFLSLCRAEN